MIDSDVLETLKNENIVYIKTKLIDWCQKKRVDYTRFQTCKNLNQNMNIVSTYSLASLQYDESYGNE